MQKLVDRAVHFRKLVQRRVPKLLRDALFIQNVLDARLAVALCRSTAHELRGGIGVAQKMQLPQPFDGFLCVLL